MREDINDIIETHKGLIYMQLHKFNLVDDPDAVSYAYEALYKAIITYDETMKYKLSTYAASCIYNALCGRMRDIKREKAAPVIYYNEVVSDTNKERIETTRISRVSSAETLVIEKSNISEIYKILRSMRSKYSGNTLTIFELWCKNDFKLNQAEVAKSLNLSQPYVSTQLSRIRGDFKEKWRQYNE